MIPRWLHAFFAWRTVAYTGAWLYEENTVTGARRARPGEWTGYQPIAANWLNGGDFDEPPVKPPVRRLPSGAVVGTAP